jgi:hypothetical protein
VLPQGKSKQQKVVLGDDQGIVTCFSMKKSEPSVTAATSFFFPFLLLFFYVLNEIRHVAVGISKHAVRKGNHSTGAGRPKQTKERQNLHCNWTNRASIDPKGSVRKRRKNQWN